MQLTDLRLTLSPTDLIFSDFDATISLEDTGLAMMRQLSPAKQEIAWELEHRWRDQQIDSMQCLSEQWALIDWSEDELLAFIDSLPIDSAFDDFARYVQRVGAHLVVVSDGLDLYVHRILQREGFETCEGRDDGGPLPFPPPSEGGGVPREAGRGGRNPLTVFANHAEVTPTGLRITFPFRDDECTQCGNCKRKHLRALRRHYQRVVYIGDGHSDRCASQDADILFAKSHLAEICDEEGRDYVPFEGFEDILRRVG
jgi:2-hydroxy-3-keto-5-methylthiopentenyl-1-phosphate phosphatase